MSAVARGERSPQGQSARESIFDWLLSTTKAADVTPRSGFSSRYSCLTSIASVPVRFFDAFFTRLSILVER